MGYSYDDRNLQRLFAEMEPERRLKALKGGFRKEANQVRKAAVNNLRSTTINTKTGLESGIRAKVFKRRAGFTVTIAARKAYKAGGKAYGFHTNRFDQEKPVLIWAEGGTEERYTKSNFGKHTRRFAFRRRARHRTGRMKRYGFMFKTRAEVMGRVEQDLRNEVFASVERVAKKYGCQ